MLISLCQSKITLLYPLDYLPTANKAQMRLIDSFVSNLEVVLGVKKTLFSLKNAWAADPPTGADSDMAEYLATVRLHTQIPRNQQLTYLE